MPEAAADGEGVAGEEGSGAGGEGRYEAAADGEGVAGEEGSGAGGEGRGEAAADGEGVAGEERAGAGASVMSGAAFARCDCHHARALRHFRPRSLSCLKRSPNTTGSGC